MTNLQTPSLDNFIADIDNMFDKLTEDASRAPKIDFSNTEEVIEEATIVRKSTNQSTDNQPVTIYSDYRCINPYNDLKDRKKYIPAKRLYVNTTSPDKFKNYVNNIIQPDNIITTDGNKQNSPCTYTCDLDEGYLTGQKGIVNYFFVDAEKKENHPAPPPRIEVEQQLLKSNISFVSYFTSSNDPVTNGHENYRIIIPLSGHYDIDDYVLLKDEVVEGNNIKFSNTGEIDCFSFNIYFDENATFSPRNMYLPYKFEKDGKIIDPKVKLNYANPFDISGYIEKAKEKHAIKLEKKRAFDESVKGLNRDDETIDKKRQNIQKKNITTNLNSLQHGERHFKVYGIGCFAGKCRINEEDFDEILREVFNLNNKSDYIKYENALNGYTAGLDDEVSEFVIKKLSSKEKQVLLENVKVDKDFLKSQNPPKDTKEYNIMTGEFLSNNKDFLKDLHNFIEEGKLIIIDSPTGSGKTKVITKYLKEKYIILEPYTNIVKQVSREANINAIHAGTHPTFDANQNEVSTYDGLSKLNKDMYNNHVLVIDESHLLVQSSSKQFREDVITNIIKAIYNKKYKAVILMSGTPSHEFLFKDFTYMKVNRIGAPVKNCRFYDTIDDKRKNIQLMYDTIIEHKDKKVQLILNNNKTVNSDLSKSLNKKGFKTICVDAHNRENADIINENNFIGDEPVVILVTSIMECGFRIVFTPNILHIFNDNNVKISPESVQQIAERPDRDPETNADRPIMDIRIYTKINDPKKTFFDKEAEYNEISNRFIHDTEELYKFIDRTNIFKSHSIDKDFDKETITNKLSYFYSDFYNTIFSFTYNDIPNKIVLSNYHLHVKYNNWLNENIKFFEAELTRYNINIEYHSNTLSELSETIEETQDNFKELVLEDLVNKTNNLIIYSNETHRLGVSNRLFNTENNMKYIRLMNDLSTRIKNKDLLYKILINVNLKKSSIIKITDFIKKLTNTDESLRKDFISNITDKEIEEFEEIHALQVLLEKGTSFYKWQLPELLKTIIEEVSEIDIKIDLNKNKALEWVRSTRHVSSKRTNKSFLFTIEGKNVFKNYIADDVLAEEVLEHCINMKEQ